MPVADGPRVRVPAGQHPPQHVPLRRRAIAARVQVPVPAVDLLPRTLRAVELHPLGQLGVDERQGSGRVPVPIERHFLSESLPGRSAAAGGPLRPHSGVGRAQDRPALPQGPAHQARVGRPLPESSNKYIKLHNYY